MREDTNKVATTDIDAHETVIGNTTFRVICKYGGDKPFLDYIKAAIKREVEAALHARKNRSGKDGKTA